MTQFSIRISIFNNPNNYFRMFIIRLDDALTTYHEVLKMV